MSADQMPADRNLPGPLKAAPQVAAPQAGHGEDRRAQGAGGPQPRWDVPLDEALAIGSTIPDQYDPDHTGIDQMLGATDTAHDLSEGALMAAPHSARLWAPGPLAALAFFCLAFAAVLPQDRLGLLAAGLGASLFALALGLLALRWGGQRTGARLIDFAKSVAEADRSLALVADGEGVIRFANPVATARFGAVTGKPVTKVFGRMLINPEAVLGPVQKGAAQKGVMAEDIVTRRGHFRLQAVAFGKGCNLWRLEQLGQGSDTAHLAMTSPDIPMLLADHSDRVVYANPAILRLLGAAPALLSDVVAQMPEGADTVQAVKPAAGLAKGLVLAFPPRDGLQQVCVLPDVEVSPTPPCIDSEWAMIEDLPVPLLKIAYDGQLIGSTREARQLLRIETTKGRRLADVLDGPGRPINDWLQEAIAGRLGQVSQFLRGRGESEDTFVQVTLSTAAGPGEDPHLIAVLNDVTELKTLEAQFVQSQKMQAIGQLAGGVAHDFNNLLTAISGHCDLLLLHHDEGDQNYNDLIQIHQNANRAASLVGQLLAFSRKQNLQLETIDLRDTLSDLTHLLNRLVGEKVTLTLDHDPELANIKGDKRQLEQVLMNLVVNARDAMNGAGEIRVVTENRVLDAEFSHGRATVPPGDYVVVQVIDKGHGIPAEKLPQIFEPFWTTKQTGEGTGLGLSTAYGIVKQTGGFIFAESEVGKGTVFSLMFPQHAQATVPPLAHAPAAPEVIHARTEGVVLLVEDEAPVRAFASRALRLRGYTVLEADCAETALELLEDPDLKVDLFVSDVIMPGLDGPTWVRKALSQRPGTGTVFVSGYPEDAFDDGEAHIPDAVFLPKPFSLRALTHTVESQLQKQLVEA